MKTMSAKKIVLFVIGFISCALLLVSLVFNVLTINSGMGTDVDGILSATGFDLLSFDFPTVVRVVLSDTMFKQSTIASYTKAFSAFSMIFLVVSVIGMVITLISFFIIAEDKNSLILLSFVVLNTVLSIAYMSTSIMFTNAITKTIKIKLGEASINNFSVRFTTTMYASLIMEATCLLAYIFCFCEMEYVPFVRKKKIGKISAKENLVGLLKGESKIIQTIEKYKQLCDDSVITASEFTDKKNKVLSYSDTVTKGTVAALLPKSTYEEIVDAERYAATAIEEYKKMFDSGLISDEEFAAKKASLMTLIIDC